MILWRSPILESAKLGRLCENARVSSGSLALRGERSPVSIQKWGNVRMAPVGQNAIPARTSQAVGVAARLSTICWACAELGPSNLNS